VSGFVSARGRRLTARRYVTTLAACALGCAVIALVAPMLGVTESGFEILPLSALGASSPLHIVWTLRAKEVAEALVVGASLAGAGCALQALLRNPLAEPFTLGLSSGSSLAAVLAIRFGIEPWLGGWGVGIAALAGAMLTLFLIVRLARIGRQLPPATLILAGVTISMFCSAANMLVQETSDFADVSHMIGWMIGGLDPGRWDGVRLLALPIAVCLIALVLLARDLDALAAGPEVAASLGVPVARTQRVVFVITSVLVGMAIAIGGPIGFVGLLVPHMLRSMLGPDHRLLLPASLFGGAALLVVCDTIARMIAWPDLLSAGAVTAVLGGPFFFTILVRGRKNASLWSSR
jgi:iron complex transport system permease protein